MSFKNNLFAIAVLAVSLTTASPIARADAGSQKNAVRKQVMSSSISTLLTRNLNDVFGENDPARQRAAIDEIWNEDGVFYDPKTGVHRGRDQTDRIAGDIRATHPDFRYQPIAEPEELGNGGRVLWVAAVPVRRKLTAGLISSLPGTAGLPPFISFSISYPELDPAWATLKRWGVEPCRLRGCNGNPTRAHARNRNRTNRLVPFSSR